MDGGIDDAFSVFAGMVELSSRDGLSVSLPCWLETISCRYPMARPPRPIIVASIPKIIVIDCVTFSAAWFDFD